MEAGKEGYKNKERREGGNQKGSREGMKNEKEDRDKNGN